MRYNYIIFKTDDKYQMILYTAGFKTTRHYSKMIEAISDLQTLGFDIQPIHKKLAA